MLLRQYFVDIVERDIRERVHARSSLSLQRLIKMTFETCGSELSLRRLAGATGLTPDTVKGYLNAAQQAYILFQCPFFAYSEKQQNTRNKKYYPIDVGLRRAVVTRLGEDAGKNLENVVFLHLRRKTNQVFYWRGKGEVDFVTMDSDGIRPYQVTWEGAKKRHQEALQEFYYNFPHAQESTLITKENVEDFFATSKRS